MIDFYWIDLITGFVLGVATFLLVCVVFRVSERRRMKYFRRF